MGLLLNFTKSKILNKEALQLLYIVILALFIPYAAIYMTSDPDHFLDLYDVCFTVFVISIIIFHLVFYLLRYFSSKNIFRYIDYVYLSIASLGVLYSAADLSAKIYKEDIDVQYNAAIFFLEYEWQGMYGKLIPLTCPQPKFKTDCEVLRELEQMRKPALDSLKNFKDDNKLMNLRAIMQKMQKTAEKSPKIARLKFFPFNQNYLYFIKQVDWLEDYTPQASWWYWNSMRTEGYYFIIVAVALRLTRVSVEMFNWAP